MDLFRRATRVFALCALSETILPTPDESPNAAPHRRRPRYAGKNPRRFEDKYKELDPQRHPEAIAKALASGRTPAGAHRPIMVAEILDALAPRPGEFGVDCTLGYGGHARELLARLGPGGHLLGLDADPIELPKTEARLREAGFGADVFTAARTNFAGLSRAMADCDIRPGADCILADLGLSSMQIDNPTRGFSIKFDGPLDMRMNPRRGQSAGELLAAARAESLAGLLRANADEPRADELAARLAGRTFATTSELAAGIRAALPAVDKNEAAMTVRRVFQALRIAVNDEFSVLEALLRQLPGSLNPGGRVAVLTFHSGEDRRVKQAFASGLREGVYSEIAREVIRTGPIERRDNPRSSSAKLRWARRA